MGMKIKMTKTLCPKEIPNGAEGLVIDGSDIESPGLHAAEFNGYCVLVYPNEVERIDKKGQSS